MSATSLHASLASQSRNKPTDLLLYLLSPYAATRLGLGSDANTIEVEAGIAGIRTSEDHFIAARLARCNSRGRAAVFLRCCLAPSAQLASTIFNYQYYNLLNHGIGRGH
jgi:hypothetical protein